MPHVDSYKFDERTKEKFIDDMTKGLKNEVVIINTFRKILDNSDIESPDIVYVGSDEEGVIIYDGSDNIANVDLFPDYLLKYKESRRIRANFIEVKVCNPHSREAYFKVKQLEQYKELEKVVILFVMGFATTTPKFALVKPEDILSLDIESEKVYGKDTIKVPASLLRWKDFSSDIKIRNIMNRRYIRRYGDTMTKG